MTVPRSTKIMLAVAGLLLVAGFAMVSVRAAVFATAVLLSAVAVGRIDLGGRG